MNLPSTASVGEVEEIYLQAWGRGVKGITVYRYGSVEGQVLTFMSPPGEAPGAVIGAEPEYAGGCAGHACEF